jgi:hypothetical protein
MRRPSENNRNSRKQMKGSQKENLTRKPGFSSTAKNRMRRASGNQVEQEKAKGYLGPLQF